MHCNGPSKTLSNVPNIPLIAFGSKHWCGDQSNGCLVQAVVCSDVCSDIGDCMSEKETHQVTMTMAQHKQQTTWMLGPVNDFFTPVHDHLRIGVRKFVAEPKFTQLVKLNSESSCNPLIFHLHSNH